MIAPNVLSWFTLAITAPSEESLSALFAATFCPFFLRMSIAFSKSPSASVRAFLQSIIPAPVVFLSFATSAATGVYIMKLFFIICFDFTLSRFSACKYSDFYKKIMHIIILN
ncbi:hypothetical protein D3C86_1341020 [compost metagenome]